MSQKQIVLVEDDPNLRQSIALILQRFGYFVTTTDCVSKAMEIIRSGNYYLVIADLNTPGTRAVLIPNVLEKFPSLSAILLTDQSTLEIEMEAELLSAYYLIKPIAPERLLESVRRIMGNNGNSNHQPVEGE